MNTMPISLFIDSNAWDLFFERSIDLHLELPDDKFSLNITQEVAYEISHMPPDKRRYVEDALNKKLVSIDKFFGFYDDSLPPEKQRVAGFDSGRFVSEKEYAVLHGERGSVGSSIRPTGLYKNEADVSLVARSTVSVVLTCDNGVLNRANNKYGGTAIDLKKWNSGESLAIFIQDELSRN